MQTTGAPAHPRASRAPRNVFHGWWMVLSGFLLMFYTTGVGFYGFTAFVNPIADALAGGSRGLVTLAVSVQRAESGLMSPIMGFLVDKVSPRIILVVGFLVGGAGYILVSLAQSLVQFYIAYFILALGLGAGSFLIVSTSVSNWFVRRRGRALGLLFLGPAFSGFLVAGIVELIDATSWRTALAVIGVGMWLWCIPLSLVFRKRPEDYGLRPDGDPPPEAAPATPSSATARGAPPARRQAVDGDFPIKTVLRSRGYWQYAFVLTLQQAGFSALVIFQVPALLSFGLTATEAGTAVLIWTLGSIPGRLGAGYLSDLVDKRLVLAGSMVLQLIGGLILLNVDSFSLAVLYGLVHGAGWGALTPSRLALQGEYWGRAIFGRLMGIQSAVSALGGIASPIFVGFIFDATQDYHPPLLVVFLPLAFCIVLTLTIARPRLSSPVPA